MNEPFLLSNLVELQDLDNKIYKLDDSEKLVFFLMLISEQLLLYFLNYFYF